MDKCVGGGWLKWISMGGGLVEMDKYGGGGG